MAFVILDDLLRLNRREVRIINAMENKPIRVGPFTHGMNNRVEAFALPKDEKGHSLRNAVNVDISDTGRVSRREGVEKKIAGTDCHSLWGFGNEAFFVDGTTLKHVDANLAVTELLTGLPVGAKMSYDRENNVVVCSNGHGLYKIVDRVAKPLCVPVPPVSPLLTAQAGGALPEGEYQAALTFVTADGEESAATEVVHVTVPKNGIVTVSGIPVSAPTGVTHVSVYVTAANDSVFYQVALLPLGQASVIVAVEPTNGVRLQTLLLSPMPASSLVRIINGRLFCVVDNVIQWSEPYWWGVTNRSRNFVALPETVTLLEAVDAGVFIGADKTYFAAGTDPEKFDLVERLPYRALPGSSAKDPVAKNVFWASERGSVVGMPDGNVKNIQEERVAVDSATIGASLVREQDGVRQLLSALFGSSQTSTFAAKSFMDAEVIRKETIL